MCFLQKTLILKKLISMQKISELILYKDNQLLILNKPAGLSVQSDQSDSKSLQDLASIYCKSNVQAPHRLDRPTSGIVVFAKTPKALSVLSEQFKHRQVKKSYLALVEKKAIKTPQTLKHWLKHLKRSNKTLVFDQEEANTKPSELEFSVLGNTDKYQVLKINPITGRTHQIRAQLAHIGFPIKGDVKYGFRRGERDRSIFLHAHEMEVTHPVSGEKILVKAPLPENNLWNAIQTFIQ